MTPPLGSHLLPPQPFTAPGFPREQTYPFSLEESSLSTSASPSPTFREDECYASHITSWGSPDSSRPSSDSRLSECIELSSLLHPELSTYAHPHPSEHRYCYPWPRNIEQELGMPSREVFESTVNFFTPQNQQDNSPKFPPLPYPSESLVQPHLHAIQDPRFAIPSLSHDPNLPLAIIPTYEVSSSCYSLPAPRARVFEKSSQQTAPLPPSSHQQTLTRDHLLDSHNSPGSPYVPDPPPDSPHIPRRSLVNLLRILPDSFDPEKQCVSEALRSLSNPPHQPIPTRALAKQDVTNIRAEIDKLEEQLAQLRREIKAPLEIYQILLENQGSEREIEKRRLFLKGKLRAIDAYKAALRELSMRMRP
ncbi:MAG: hypothetical protein ACSNEK_02330 [Parachlamydiaceae bacterium]